MKMYKVVTVGGRVVETLSSRMEAVNAAREFANRNCTFTKVYCGSTLIAVFS